MTTIWTKATTAAAVVAGTLALLVASASAAVDPTIDGAFTSTSSNMLDYAGSGVAMVLAVFAVSVGLRVLIKFGKRASGAA